MTTTTPRIIEIDWDGEIGYVVWGEDPAEILRIAQEEAESEERVITTPLEEIKVISIRTVPCTEYNCDFASHTAHYMATTPGSRGSFRGAFLYARPLDDEEIDEVKSTFRWGVGSDGEKWPIAPYKTVASAERVLEYRNTASGYRGPHWLYYRASGGSPWRRVNANVSLDLFDVASALRPGHVYAPAGFDLTDASAWQEVYETSRRGDEVLVWHAGADDDEEPAIFDTCAGVYIRNLGEV